MNPQTSNIYPQKEKGRYIVICGLDALMDIRIGRLGTIRFSPGYYAYAGSALGGLKARILRHLNPPAEKLRWHIDYLSARARPVGAVWGESDGGRECVLANFLSESFDRVAGFGASDCRCESHLFHARDARLLFDAAASAFQGLGIEPHSIVL